MTSQARLGCFPGSFNPPTIAHLAIASAARDTCGLDRIDLVVSRVALAKEDVVRPRLEDRVAVLGDVVRARRSWLGLVVTEARLLVDVSQGYDVLVLGADKWAQVLDPAFYGGSETARDSAVGALPALALAPRPGAAHPAGVPPRATLLHLPAAMAAVSSTGVRHEGRHDWMAPEAADFDDRTGAWSDPGRYEEWVAGGAGR